MKSVYLHDIPLAEAKKIFDSALETAGLAGVLAVEEIPLDEDANGRVLADTVWAKISSPSYNASAMDGFAVRSEDTIGAMPSQSRILDCAAASKDSGASYVDTGDPIPEWADAVIPVEYIEALDKNGEITESIRHPATIRIRAAVSPWQNVRPMGEDMVASQLVLPSGHVLRPVDLGAIAASGHTSLLVAQQPRIAIIPTGSELIPIGQDVQVGQILEFNSLVLAGQVNSWGGKAARYPIIPDDFKSIRDVVSEAALKFDLILLNAGSSAGSEDFSAQVVAELGDLLVHGVAVRPGHPVILGMITVSDERQAVPIIGVPGFPVSAALTAEIFVEPLIARWSGRHQGEPVSVEAIMTRKIASPAGDDDYLRVMVGQVRNKLLAAPLPRGSGVISSLVRADGITIIPAGTQGIQAGDLVTVHLSRPVTELSKTIFVIGSHDMTLDLMAQFLSVRDRKLASSNVGSVGGLIALRRGEAHLAGSHLLDPQTGEYNLSYIRQYLPGVAVNVVDLVGRQQGLIVRKGNPKKIKRLEDLRRPDVVISNRQRGAGTRVLLDYHLNELGIAPESIKGYELEEYTHLAVAAAVASGRADAGLGIAAAAQALDLEFVPLYQEVYQFVIPNEFYRSQLLQPVLELLADLDFQKSVASLPGYDVTHMGRLVIEISE